MKIIEKEQENLLKLANNYILRMQDKGIDVSKSTFCYLNAQEVTPGYCKLKNLQFNKKFSFQYIFITVKHLLSVATLHNFEVFNNKDLKFDQTYEKLIISWASKKDFKSDGSFIDPKFKTSSKDQTKTLWFIIYRDDNIPDQINQNILLFCKNKNKLKYNFLYLLKVIFKLAIKNKKDFYNLFHELSLQSHFAEIVSKLIKKIVLLNNLKLVLMPYESQPFQNKTFLEIKNLDKKIKTVGYTAVTQPFPSHNIYRLGAPDYLFVHGFSEAHHLQNNLNWPKQKLKLIPSLKFKIDDNVRFDGKIFIPYSIMNDKLLLKEFKNFLIQNKNWKLTNLMIKNHPYRENSILHKKFIKGLEKVISTHENKSSEASQKNVSIFFCETYAIVEALERGSEVIHICSDAVFESYSEKLWPAIKVEQISDNSFLYKLKKNGQCIDFGKKEDTFNKCFNSVL